MHLKVGSDHLRWVAKAGWRPMWERCTAVLEKLVARKQRVDRCSGAVVAMRPLNISAAFYTRHVTLSCPLTPSRTMSGLKGEG